MDDDRAGALYGLPLDRFVAARNELAKELKDAGDAEGAKAVRALEKPSVPAWAVNQVARADPKAIEDLIDIGDRLREAQEALLSGGDPKAVREVSEEEKRAVSALTKRAVAFLAEAGNAPNAAREERVADTFFALAADAEAREAVRAGRLTKELQRVGFGGLDLAAIAAAPPRPRPARTKEAAPEDEAAARDAERAEAAREAEELQGIAEEAEAKAERLRAAAEDVEREAAKKRDEANRSRREAERARREADAAAKRLRELD